MKPFTYSFSKLPLQMFLLQMYRMCSLHAGLSVEAQTWSFRVLTVQLTVILLLLTEARPGQSQGPGPAQIVTALVGEDVVLPCHLEPAADAVSSSVEWGRLDLEPRFVHVWHEGQNLLVNQNPAYRERTSVSPEKLRTGDLSLQLSAVTHSDNGRYRCLFPSQRKTTTVQLVVGSVSSPVITKISRNSRGAVELDCESKGWYPEPEVLWLDSEGNLLSAGPTETLRAPDDLYTVSSRLTVEKRHGNSFTCRVQQTHINQTRLTHIQLSDDFKVQSSDRSATAALAVCLVVSILFILVYFIWKCRKNKTQSRRSDKTDHGGKKNISKMNQTEGDRVRHQLIDHQTVQIEDLSERKVETEDSQAERRQVQSFFPWTIISRQKLQDEEETRREAQKQEKTEWEKKLQDEKKRRMEAEEEVKTLRQEKGFRDQQIQQLKRDLQTQNTQWEKKLQDEEKRKMEAEEEVKTLRQEKESRDQQIQQLKRDLQTQNNQVPAQDR
ncbi:butyrophilin subfamily 3 member A2-like isoform X2 [Mastacembelus armatus]|uniref:Butyrophilin subfamily 3 member A2-like n=1 Tax=Mastacembelus armatus TaxID=205130 RepID=A0A3Q3LFU1_9TELE|nr:butyrophilin subfamily 3 member A2-like isoform X2 [Mastacembelus armatus]